MSDVAAAEAKSSPSSVSAHLAINAAGDGISSPVYSMLQTPSLAQVQPQPQPPPKSKRYSPPKADSNTFATQKAFLDSLHPMSLDEVDADKQKCPICWKCFGEEPDPGFDNSELPVKLRCHHVFGHKCLADIFGIPASTSLELQPLQYSSGKKGRLLGHKLAVYHALHSAKFRNDFELFEHMLTTQHREKGPEIFGQHWWPIVLQILHSHRGLSQITLMENAVVLDYEPLTVKKHQHTQLDPAVISPHLSAASSSFEQTLLDAADGYGPHTDLVVHAQDYMPTMPTAFSAWSTSSLAPSQPTPIPGYESSGYPPQGPTGSPLSSQISWEDALTKVETNLDKLKALQKQKENAAQPDTAAAQKAKTLQAQAAMEEARRQEVERAQAMERRKHDIRTSLAHRLVEIFAKFVQYRTSEIGEFADDGPPRVIHASITIHADDLEKTTYSIAPPMMGPFFDEDGDSDDEEVDNLTSSTMLILRTQCGGCCMSLEDRSLATPKGLTWRNNKNTPDSCPLCHKVLFKKSSGR